jgi:hypothetical protein
VARSFSAFVYPVTTDEGWQLFFALPAANCPIIRRKLVKSPSFVFLKPHTCAFSASGDQLSWPFTQPAGIEGEIGMDFNGS